MKIPENELREFKLFRLKNNIPVFYIKDIKLEKPIFYLSVSVGSLEDPKDFLGLAHFLEHLIFMGSSKYQEENHFNEILNKYQGETNAYTANDKTVYYFSSLQSGFDEIIDIFYYLNKEPLLSKSSQEREVNAVNSEHEKNILNDSWRVHQLISHLSKEEHPLSRFSTGNLETLNKSGSIEAVRKFFKKYYHSGNISILLGDSREYNYYQDLLNSNFGTLEMTKKTKLNYDLPFNKYRDVFLETENNNKKLILVWDCREINQQNDPSQLLNEIICNTQIKSLKKVLLDMGLIKSINIGSEESTKNFEIVTMRISLTELGCDNINKIKSIILKYIDFLLEQDFNELINDFKIKNEIFFNYEPKPNSFDLASEIIEDMNETEDLLFYSYNFSGLNNDIIKSYLNVIKSHHTILLVPKSLNKLEILKEHYEKYYKMKYYEIKLSDEKIEDVSFEFPNKNKYLEEPKLLKGKSQELVRENNNYYRFNYKWKTPVVYKSFQIYYENMEDNYLSLLQTVNVLNYQIREYFFDALLLGYRISVNLYFSKNIIEFRVIGYNTKINEIVKELFENLGNLGNFEKYMELVNSEMRYDLEKYKTNPPIKLGNEYLKKIILPLFKTNQELLENYSDLKIHKFNQIVRNILKGKKNIYQYGNFIQKISSESNFEPIIKNNKLPKNLTIKHPNEKEKNKSFYKVFPIGLNQLKIIAFGEIIDTLMSEKFFDVLRTKKQLGYLVNQSYGVFNNQVYIIQRIQTHKEISETKELVEQFNLDYLTELKELTDLQFTELKNNLVKSILKEMEKMSEQFSLDLNEIINGTLIFNRKELLGKEIKKVKKNDVLKFIESMLGNSFEIIVH